MNWQGIDEGSKTKVESLMQAFDQFVTTHHRKGTEPQDKRIVKEWAAFKDMIQRTPADTQGHNKHVSALRNTLLKEEVSKHMGQVGHEEVERELNTKNIDIDKATLLTISRELKRNVLRHTKDPLNLLD